jgi:hypothetical protein
VLLKLVVADLLVVIPAFDVEIGVGRDLNYCLTSARKLIIMIAIIVGQYMSTCKQLTQQYAIIIK